jgi:hypothetical protein
MAHIEELKYSSSLPPHHPSLNRHISAIAAPGPTIAVNNPKTPIITAQLLTRVHSLFKSQKLKGSNIPIASK